MQFSGALYHVTARGNERKPIFRDKHDRPARVRKYLSQYLSAEAQTQRVAISNRRLRLAGDGSPLHRPAADLGRTPLLHRLPPPRFPPFRDILTRHAPQPL